MKMDRSSDFHTIVLIRVWLFYLQLRDANISKSIIIPHLNFTNLLIKKSPTRRNLALRYLELPRYGAFGKEAFTGAEGEWINHQPEGIHQVVADEVPGNWICPVVLG